VRPRANVTIDSLYEVVYEESIGSKMNTDSDIMSELLMTDSADETNMFVIYTRYITSHCRC